MENKKPTYSVCQNTRFIVKQAWTRDKIVLFVIAAQIFLTVAIATVGIFLPAAVVEQITRGVELRTLVLTVLGFTAVTVVLQGWLGYLNTGEYIRRTGLRLHYMMDFLDKILTTDYANIENKDFSDAKQKAINQANSNTVSSEIIYYRFKDLGINVLGFIVYLVLLTAINPLVMVIVVASCVFGAWARRRANRWWHNNDTEETAPNKRIWYVNHMHERPTLAKDIRLFSMTRWVTDVFNANMKLVFAFRRKGERKSLYADGIDAVAVFLREGIAYAYLIGLVISGSIGVEAFVLLFAAVGGFSGWVTGILNDYAALSRTSMEFCRVREFLEYPDRFNKGNDPIPPSQTYSLELKNVSFRYVGTEEYTLENINLRIQPGEKLAIVGLNGVGKTTLVKLLCGLYDPTMGEVLLNGTDIRSFNRNAYYELFTAVFQEFNIVPMSIERNITQSENSENPARLQECMALAGIDKKINALPEGVESLLIKQVHYGATELSGGETQRLMLARALYKNAPMLILDEPTAALDPIAESELYTRYNELSEGRTSVYISHRLASTRFCDRIILLDGKGIAEMGTHDELIRNGGKYAELFEIQSKYYRDEVA